MINYILMQKKKYVQTILIEGAPELTCFGMLPSSIIHFMFHIG